jgi:NitT/TauT family transport system ATP-binding protein
MNEIDVNDVAFSYGGEVILKDLSFSVQQGDFLCILGESGCGKSTLMRLLAGLDFPQSGTVKTAGHPVQGPGLDRSVVFQNYDLYPWLSTGANMVLTMKQNFRDKSKGELRSLIEQSFERVGLEKSVFDKYPNELSGGMRQRCALCRALALDSSIMLMDEPFGALDAITRNRLQNLIIDLWERETPRKTVVFVTHDVNEALYLATKIIVLGQKPSKVIYSCEIQRHEHLSHEDILDDERFKSIRQDILDALAHNTQEKVKEYEYCN